MKKYSCLLVVCFSFLHQSCPPRMTALRESCGTQRSSTSQNARQELHPQSGDTGSQPLTSLRIESRLIPLSE